MSIDAKHMMDTYEADLARLRQQVETMNSVGNLLAVIHGDGGHYITEHGWAKAEQDARTKWKENQHG